MTTKFLNTSPGHEARPLLQAEEVGKSFRRKHGLLRSTDHVCALRSVTFSVDAGETVGIIGESGSGKTTLAHCIVRLLRPTSGRLLFNGEDIHRLRGDALRRFQRSVQIVFQNPYLSLDPRMTVQEIVEEPLQIHGLRNGRGRTDRVRRMIDLVRLESNALDAKPGELSGGQQQRVAIARALVLEPRLIVCDEPTASLDLRIQAQVLSLLKELQSSLGVSYVIVTHDISILRNLADRLLVIRDGISTAFGKFGEITQGVSDPYIRDLIDFS